MNAVDEAIVLAEYLPLSYKTQSEEDYIAFLWDAFTSNYENEKHQFAFFAFHMLTMCVVYFNVWQIRQARPEAFNIALIGFSKEDEKHLLKATSPFTFHKIKEQAIMRVLRLIECDNAQIGNYAKLVQDRNGTAHANGNIYYKDQRTLDLKINDVLKAVEEIQTQSKPVIEESYRRFLEDSTDPEEREYFDEAEQVREILIHGQYFSQRDADICRTSDLSWADDHEHEHAIRSLHAALQDLYPAPED